MLLCFLSVQSSRGILNVSFWKTWKWLHVVTFGLLAQLLSYAVIRIICLTTGWARFYKHRWSFTNSLQVGGKSLKSLEVKFLTMDCVVIEGYQTRKKTPMESFPSIVIGNWLRICCLSRKTFEGLFLEGKLLKKAWNLLDSWHCCKCARENSNMADPT